jgi:hypothetical protein
MHETKQCHKKNWLWPSSSQKLIYGNTFEQVLKIMPVVKTMVGDVDAGDLDFGDEESQIEQVKTPPKDGGSDNIRVAGL